jgi:hypothetical protein
MADETEAQAKAEKEPPNSTQTIAGTFISTISTLQDTLALRLISYLRGRWLVNVSQC